MNIAVNPSDHAADIACRLGHDHRTRGITKTHVRIAEADHAADGSGLIIPRPIHAALDAAADHRAVFQRLHLRIPAAVKTDHRARPVFRPDLRVLDNDVFNLRLAVCVLAVHAAEKALIYALASVDFQPRDDVVLPVENARKGLIDRADRRPVAVCGQVHVVCQHIMRRDERRVPRVDILRQLGQLRGAGNLERRVRPAHRQQGNASLALLHDIQILRLFFERQRGLILNRLGPFKIRLRIAFRRGGRRQQRQQDENKRHDFFHTSVPLRHPFL